MRVFSKFIFIAVFLCFCKPMPNRNQKTTYKPDTTQQHSASVGSDTLSSTEDSLNRIVPRDSSAEESILTNFDTAVEVLLGSEVVAVLQKSQRVKAYTLKPLAAPDSSSRLFERFVIADSLVISAVARGVLNFLVQDSAHYDQQALPIKQPFTPVVVFHFEEGGEQVNVYICFDTNEFGFQKQSGAIRRIFFTCRRQLLRLCKLLFSENPYLKFY